MKVSGLAKSRFDKLPADSFDCLLCKYIALNPFECHYCGKVFCKLCLTYFSKKNQSTPCGCRSKITYIFSKALIRMYNNLDIKCSNVKCGKMLKLSDLGYHYTQCLQYKCWNYPNCMKNQNRDIVSERPCCSILCLGLEKLYRNFGDKKAMYEVLKYLYGEMMLDEGMGRYQYKVRTSCVKLNKLTWDPNAKAVGIDISDAGAKCFLREQFYLFKTVISQQGFMGGVNYWEIYADAQTENELKIGVTLKKDFDLNSAFCDHAFGFAYYGLGQLRHNSNTSGRNYGKRFKKYGVLGCCLNMDKGTLAFALDGEYMGEAFVDDKLKNGPIYVAVSLLHCAGCTMKIGTIVPQYFL